jgi:hypothetical protein
VPYDGLDQDCDGVDLVDVDKDGYNSTAVTGGTDCADNNPMIHPGAEEIPYDTVDQDCDGSDTVLNGAFEIAPQGSISGWPNVAFNGTNYLVVWYQYVSTATNRYQIRGQLVSASGSKVGSMITIVATNSPLINYEPAVASDGTNFLVVWRRYSSSGTVQYGILGQLVSGSGSLTGSVITVDAMDANYKYLPNIAFGGGVYAVVWRERIITTSTIYHVMGQLVEPSGTLQGTGFQATTSHGYNPTIAYGSSGFLITWYYSYYVYGRVLSTSGTFPGGVITICNQTSSSSYPHAAFDGTNFLTAWHDYRNSTANGYDIYGQRVSASGSLVGSASNTNFAISTGLGYQYYPRVLFCGGRYNVLFRDNRYMSRYGLFRQPVSTSGTLEDAAANKNILMYADLGSVYWVAAACGGSTALVTWTENISGYYKVMGQIFTP